MEQKVDAETMCFGATIRFEKIFQLNPFRAKSCAVLGSLTTDIQLTRSFKDLVTVKLQLKPRENQITGFSERHFRKFWSSYKGSMHR
jgi:hypothetical protein